VGVGQRRWVASAFVIALLALAGAATAILGDEDEAPLAAAGGVSVERWSIASEHVPGPRRQVALVPREARGRPLLVFLHGRGRRGEEAHANRAFARSLAALGADAPVVVFPNGGEASYWHDRRSGEWAAYVLEEVIPDVRRRFATDPRRLAIGGISMGGFGAFAIARRAPERFCAVGGHSTALWSEAGQTPAGAFDDAEDFARHDLLRLLDRARLARAAVWLDVGVDDPFRDAGRRLASNLGVALHEWPGGHDGAYWRSHYDEYLRFYADALRDC
jgi:S-formylglutathione hydrolase FrmB